MESQVDSCRRCGSADVGLTKNWNRGVVCVECQYCGEFGPNFPCEKGSAAKARDAWNKKQSATRTKYIFCESCGRDFGVRPGLWECPHCGFDNKQGEERGKWFQRYCVARSTGLSEEDSKKQASL